MTTTFLFKNNAISTLSGPISAVATTINVASGSGVLFPAPGTAQYFALTLVSASNPTLFEIVYCTGVSGDAMTVVRAREGTVALAFSAGDIADHRLTAAALTSFAVASGIGTIVGRSLNLSGARASTTTATWTADEIVVKTAIGGSAVAVSAYNKTINLSTTGAGGMDTGSAPTSGWLYIYAIYNPATDTASILGTVAGTGQVIYPGANMPSGYTYSALISALRTNASAYFQAFSQRDNQIFGPTVTIGSGLAATTLTAVSLSTVVPPNAKTCGVGIVNYAGSACNINIASDSAGVVGANWTAGGVIQATNYFPASFLTPQTLYYAAGAAGANITLNVSTYTI